MIETSEKISPSSSHARKDLEFFKVFLPELASTELVIPPAFIDILEKPLPNEVILVDEIERSWCVETETQDTEEIFRVLFKKGWRNFVNDQSLEFGDFLVFRFDGVERFSVTIFAKDGCRKFLGGIVTSTDKSRVSFENEPNPITKPVEKESVVEPADEDRDVEPVDEDMNARLVDSLTETQRRIVNGMSTKRKRRRDPVVIKKPEDMPSCGTKPEHGDNTRRKVNQAGDPCDITFVSSDKKQESVDKPVRKPDNPHFVRTINHASLHRLEIPRTLLKSNGIDLEDDVELCDENGKKWPLKIARFDRSIRFAKASWLCFVKGRKLTINTKCLFEFVVKSNGRCSEIQVRTIRGKLRTIVTKSGYQVLAM